MPTRSSSANWQGNVQTGSGTLTVAGDNYPYSYKTRMAEDSTATNPEELIAAAQASCYSMALAARLSTAGYRPEHIETTCDVGMRLSGLGLKITAITIKTRARVSGLTAEQFAQHATVAKDNCPISQALAAVAITLDATLLD